MQLVAQPGGDKVKLARRDLASTQDADCLQLLFFINDVEQLLGKAFVKLFRHDATRQRVSQGGLEHSLALRNSSKNRR